MRVALVQDLLIRLGGAERVLKTLTKIFPEAPIYTLLYDEKKVGAQFPREKIRTSRMQRLPAILRKNHRYLLPLMPRAIEEWDFSQFDVVISSNTAFAHGIITAPSTRHICYCHSPTRYCWDWAHEYMRENRLSGIKKIAAAHILKKIRMWDRAAADRVDQFIANSRHVRQRIKKYYRSDAQVIYPPVDISRFRVSDRNDNFFLIVSTLTPYKRIDLAVQLFNKIRRRLVIVGEGPQREYLQRIAGDTIEFLGHPDDSTVTEHLQNCTALIFPGEEDFGIAPVEAMAAGKPVLAFGEGGVKESVIAGVTGEFFSAPTVASLEDGLARLIKKYDAYEPEKCRLQAEKFSEAAFAEAIKKLVWTSKK